MGRNREFELAEVLAAAAQVFADHGYHGTSITQLVAATGLQRGSLYAAFGSKAGLFSEVIATLEIQTHSRESILDLLTVALRERAATDRAVAKQCLHLIGVLGAGDSAPIEEQVFSQLLRRAHLTNLNL